MEFENFEKVWQRVTERDEPEITLPERPDSGEEKICLIKRGEKSCAVRFLPRFLLRKMRDPIHPPQVGS